MSSLPRMTPDDTRVAQRRRTLSAPLAYALAGAVILLALFASATPTPLYETYRELWGFSPVVLTLVYATYAFGVLASLVLAGRVSDEVGRRPVLAAALTGLILSAILFLLADSIAWLFAARALQGLTTGTALGAAGTLRVISLRRDDLEKRFPGLVDVLTRGA